jgi:uncharacterized protein (UPF0548 family)
MRFGVQVPRVRPPSTVELDRLLTEARAAAPTYPEVGATRDAHLPPGYRHDSYERGLGSGDEVFERAVRALRGWQAQIGAGARVWPAGAWVEEGSTAVLLLPVGGLWVLGACRVVYVDESPHGFAFAYGTLPGHPERGEVAFRIERRAADEVVFRIVSFSRTVDPLARLGSPIVRRIQQRVTTRYLAAIGRLVAS